MDRFLDKIFLLRRAPEADWPRWKRAAYAAWPIFLLACASVCMGLLLLVFAYGQYSWGAFLDVKHWPDIKRPFNDPPIVVNYFFHEEIIPSAKKKQKKV